MSKHSNRISRIRLIALSGLVALVLAACAGLGYVSVRLAGDSIKPGDVQRSGETRFSAAPRLLASAELLSGSLEIRAYRDDEASGQSFVLTPSAADIDAPLSGGAGLWRFELVASGDASGGAFEAELSDR